MKNNQISNRNLRFLILGRTVSLFGASIYFISLPLFILQITNSLAQSGLFFSLVSIPSVMITPFLGVLIERINRKHLTIFCDFSVSMIYFCLFFLEINNKMQIAILLVASMIINILSSAFEISTKVLFTELNNKDTIEKYNGIKSVCDNASSLIAPAIGTFIFGTYGFHVVILIVAATYTVSAILECFICYHQTQNLYNKPDDDHNFGRQLTNGLHFILSKPNILALFLLVMSLNFFVANSDEIINPGILIQKFKISNKLFGLTTTASIIGTLLAGLFIFKNKKYNIRKHIKSLFIVNSACMILIGLFSLILFNFTQIGYFFLFIALQLIIGFISTCINVPLSSYFQVQVPLEYQARFFSILSFSSSLLVPLGVSYTGLLASHIGADTAYIINNLCIIIIVFVVFTMNKKLNEFFLETADSDNFLTNSNDE